MPPQTIPCLAIVLSPGTSTKANNAQNCVWAPGSVFFFFATTAAVRAAARLASCPRSRRPPRRRLRTPRCHRRRLRRKLLFFFLFFLLFFGGVGGGCCCCSSSCSSCSSSRPVSTWYEREQSASTVTPDVLKLSFTSGAAGFGVFTDSIVMKSIVIKSSRAPATVPRFARPPFVRPATANRILQAPPRARVVAFLEAVCRRCSSHDNGEQSAEPESVIGRSHLRPPPRRRSLARGRPAAARL